MNFVDHPYNIIRREHQNWIRFIAHTSNSQFENMVNGDTKPKNCALIHLLPGVFIFSGSLSSSRPFLSTSFSSFWSLFSISVINSFCTGVHPMKVAQNKSPPCVCGIISTGTSRPQCGREIIRHNAVQLHTVDSDHYCDTKFPLKVRIEKPNQELNCHREAFKREEQKEQENESHSVTTFPQCPSLRQS